MKIGWIVVGIFICSLTLKLPEIMPKLLSLHWVIRLVLLILLVIAGLGSIYKGLFAPMLMPKHDRAILRKGLEDLFKK